MGVDRELPLPRRVSVLGSFYSELTREEVNGFLLRAAELGIPGYVCVSNVHTTMTGLFDHAYRRITNEALLAVPDGVPLVWAMRSLGARAQDRVRGPSLMPDLFDLGRKQGARHYLYGSSPETLRMLQDKLLARFPGALIVGAESPPFRPLEEISEPEWEAAAARINASGAQFVWVGLGAPKQERWIWEQRNRVHGVMFAIGAAFDLLAERIPEAPPLLQRLGLEWAYRLWREPRRLWRRYLFNNPAFLLLWGGQLMQRALGRSFFVSRED